MRAITEISCPAAAILSSDKWLLWCFSLNIALRLGSSGAMWLMAALIEPLLTLTCITHTGSSLLTQRINSLVKTSTKTFSFPLKMHQPMKWTPVWLRRRIPPDIPVDFCRVSRVRPVGAPANCAPLEKQATREQKKVWGSSQSRARHRSSAASVLVHRRLQQHFQKTKWQSTSKNWQDFVVGVKMEVNWLRLSECRVHTLQVVVVVVVVCRSPGFYTFWRHCVFLMVVSTNDLLSDSGCKLVLARNPACIYSTQPHLCELMFYALGPDCKLQSHQRCWRCYSKQITFLPQMLMVQHADRVLTNVQWLQGSYWGRIIGGKWLLHIKWL